MPSGDFNPSVLCGTLTTTNGINAGTFSGGGNCSIPAQTVTNGYSYTYPWPYGYSYTTYPDTRVAKLEGEVAVLREMVAALLAGRDVKPTPRRKR